MDGMGSTNVFNARFGQTEEAHLAFPHEIADGPGDILHRHGPVDPMLVEQTIEVIDIEKPHPQIGVLDFMKAVTDRLSQIFEVMIASLCGHNTKALGGLPIVMMELPTDQRSASHVRFSYGLQDGSRIVPMM